MNTICLVIPMQKLKTFFTQVYFISCITLSLDAEIDEINAEIEREADLSIKHSPSLFL